MRRALSTSSLAALGNVVVGEQPRSADPSLRMGGAWPTQPNANPEPKPIRTEILGKKIPGEQTQGQGDGERSEQVRSSRPTSTATATATASGSRTAFSKTTGSGSGSGLKPPKSILQADVAAIKSEQFRLTAVMRDLGDGVTREEGGHPLTAAQRAGEEKRRRYLEFFKAVVMGSRIEYLSASKTRSLYKGFAEREKDMKELIGEEAVILE